MRLSVIEIQAATINAIHLEKTAEDVNCTFSVYSIMSNCYCL